MKFNPRLKYVKFDVFFFMSVINALKLTIYISTCNFTSLEKQKHYTFSEYNIWVAIKFHQKFMQKSSYRVLTTLTTIKINY